MPAERKQPHGRARPGEFQIASGCHEGGWARSRTEKRNNIPSDRDIGADRGGPILVRLAPCRSIAGDFPLKIQMLQGIPPSALTRTNRLFSLSTLEPAAGIGTPATLWIIDSHNALPTLLTRRDCAINLLSPIHHSWPTSGPPSAPSRRRAPRSAGCAPG